jgi:hypothetical protein
MPKTMPEMTSTNLKLWDTFHDILDMVLTNGIYDTPNFGRGHREFLFAYISRKNNCYYCSTNHFLLAKELGVENLDKEIVELTDSLYNNIAMPVADEITPLIEQILYTISVAKFINTQVVAHDVQLSPTSLIKTPTFLESGYSVAFKSRMSSTQ